MAARQLPYPVFDADNHFYEPKEALTQFLPEHRKGVIDYIDVRGRTKSTVRNVVSDYIPNPTFEVVARPGAQEEYFRHGSGGKSFREVMGKPMKAIPAFRDPAARLEVLDSLGLDYTLMFPTLASLVEERLKDDPDLILDIVHALNEWMYETWQFNYENRIFSTPVINLAVVDRALEELQWCLERGAKTVLVRPAPVPGYRGTRSLGLEEFDPFWEDDFAQMAELCGVDRVIFGSDWPHPEGLAEPTNLIDDLQGLDAEGQRKVMGGNMISLFKIPNEVVHKPDVPALVLT